MLLSIEMIVIFFTIYECNSRKKPSGRQWNRILDAVVTIIKYKKSKIDHTIYIKVFSYGKVSYITASSDDFLSTTNNEIVLTELTRFVEEKFDKKFQEGSVLKYLNLGI